VPELFPKHGEFPVTSISIRVRNFRGCASADVECSPLALVGGLNAVGKSSIAQAVGAALSGNALPVAGLRANAAGVLVRVGAATGTVEVGNAEGSCTVEWPAARVTTHGRPPQASAYAVGLETIAPPMTAKDRLRILAEYLHADPTREDLAAALNEAGLDPELVLKSIWPLIEQSGWDGAVTARRDRGAELKGQWRQCTGANYGSRVAASWRPDLGELKENDLLAEVARTSNERDRALSAQAVSADERRRLEEEAELCQTRQDALGRAVSKVEEYTAAYQKAQQARAALPPAGKQDVIPCPHCGGPIVINKVSLVETRFEKPDAAALDSAELGKRRMAIAEADGKLSLADKDLQEARRFKAAAENAVKASESARERIANWPRAVETGTDIATAEAQLQRAEKRLVEYRSKTEADRLHRLVEGNELVISLLAADGLRAKKLGRVIDVFNAQLGNLAQSAFWRGVRLDDAGNLAYGDRPYSLLSTSEQYRVRAVLAVAMAQIDGSELIILDGIDILDAPSRGQLIGMLEEVEIPTLITMTVARREQLPDLAASELGRSYWLAVGVLEPLEVKVAA
jgi:hypothetical protein